MFIATTARKYQKRKKNNDKRSTIKSIRSIYSLANEQQNRRGKVNEKMKERHVMLFELT